MKRTVLLFLALLLLLSACAPASNAVTEDIARLVDETEQWFYESIPAKYIGYSRPDFIVTASEIYGAYEEEDTLRVFVTTMYCGASVRYDRRVNINAPSLVLSSLTFTRSPGGWELVGRVDTPSVYNAEPEEGFCVLPVSGKPIPRLGEDIRTSLSEDLYVRLAIKLFDKMSAAFDDMALDVMGFTFSDFELRWAK